MRSLKILIRLSNIVLISRFCLHFRLSIRPLINFMLFFGIIFWAFAMFGYAVFGKNNEDYYNLVASMETLFAMMLMNFNFEALYETNKYVYLKKT